MTMGVITMCAIISIISFFYHHFTKNVWEIEYRPHFKKYYPKHNGLYLQWWSTYKNYRHEEHIGLGISRNTEEEAKELIEEIKIYWGQSKDYTITKL